MNAGDVVFFYEIDDDNYRTYILRSGRLITLNPERDGVVEVSGFFGNKLTYPRKIFKTKRECLAFLIEYDGHRFKLEDKAGYCA